LLPARADTEAAPVPRKKEGRAARLAAMMERDGHAGGPMAECGAGAKAAEDSGTDSPPVQGLAVEAVAEEAVALEA
jgi:hypothetical protein